MLFPQILLFISELIRLLITELILTFQIRCLDWPSKLTATIEKLSWDYPQSPHLLLYHQIIGVDIFFLNIIIIIIKCYSYLIWQFEVIKNVKYLLFYCNFFVLKFFFSSRTDFQKNLTFIIYILKYFLFGSLNFLKLLKLKFFRQKFKEML